MADSENSAEHVAEDPTVVTENVRIVPAEVPFLQANLEDGNIEEDPDWESTDYTASSGTESSESSESEDIELMPTRNSKKRCYNETRGPVQGTSTDMEPMLHYDQRGPVQGTYTGSVPREVTRRLTKIMSVGLESSLAKSLRDKATPAFDSKTFALKCPNVDESMLIIFKRFKDIAAEAAEKHYLSFQYKVMDIAKPLLALRGACESEETTVDNIRTLADNALDLWAVAFNNVTHNRRRNILKVTDAELLLLLNNPDHFSENEIAYLFGDKFVAAMRNQASHMSTMAHVKRVTSGRGRPSFQQPRRYFRNDDNPRPSTSGRGHSNARYGNLLPTTANYIGGRLQHFADEWHLVTTDPWIISSLKEGLAIDFISIPTQSTMPKSVPMGEDQETICDDEVSNLLKKGAIVRVHNDSDGFCSSLFVIPKKSGGHRPIINLRPLNNFVNFEHFKMEGIQTVKELVRPGDWMVSLDLKDAYLTIPISPMYQKFLQFVWRNIRYQFICLPFGLGPAPRVFTKILRPVVAYLRSNGLRLVIYLDDILLLNESAERIKIDLETTVNLLHKLGFLINWEKSDTKPTQKITYLGLMINSIDLTFSLPEKKVTEVITFCSSLRKSGRADTRKIQSLLGHLNWASNAVIHARAHCRSLQQDLKAQLSFNQVALSADSILELEWWIHHLSSRNGKTFAYHEPDLIIFSDASLQGWGATTEGTTANGPWSQEYLNWHINELELLAAYFALQTFTKHAKKASVLMFLDNTVAVSYINRDGGTKSPKLNDIVKQICNWCDERELALRAEHVPGVANTIADAESRTYNDSSDWQLSIDLFRQIQAIWPAQIDLFASHWNAQLPKFISWRPQPNAFSTNAFAFDWSSCIGYAFPPFSLIGRCLSKIRREKANVILVCPYWPSQSWFPDLLQLVCDIVLVMPTDRSTLVGPRKNPHPLLDQGQMLVTVWKLSGHSSVCKDFRNAWSTCYWAGHANPQKLHMQPLGSIGTIGVVHGTRIPCRMI